MLLFLATREEIWDLVITLNCWRVEMDRLFEDRGVTGFCLFFSLFQEELIT